MIRLPFFTGIAVHDARKPYDTFENVAGHALCGAHVLRELTAVTETGTDLDRAWAQQAIDALLALDKAAEAARAAGEAAMDPKTREEHEDWYRKPRPPGSRSTPAAAASSARNGTPSPPGCRPARTTTCGSPATRASRLTITKLREPSG